MSTHKWIDRICCAVLALTLGLTVLFMNGKALGIQSISRAAAEYEERLFDPTVVHSVDIVMDDWESFLASCENEEYALCSLVIDGKACRTVGLRAKGNTSLTQVKNTGTNRYSFKVEFDHYDSANTYYGLDKLSLNNIIQDNTYMKDFLTYQMMGAFGAAAPLCSYAWLTVNGQPWGLYLAVEGVEESFLTRNFGADYGELYKPDSSDLGGGRGNGGGFRMSDWSPEEESEQGSSEETLPEFGQTPPDGNFPGAGKMPPDGDFSGSGQEFPGGNFPGAGQKPPDGDFSGFGQGFPGGDSSGSGQESSDGNFPGFGQGQTPPGGDSKRGDGSFSGADRRPNDGKQPGPGGAWPGGNPGGMGMKGGNDVSLIYSDDEYSSYRNIFDNAKTDVTDRDKDRLIRSLKALNEGTDISSVVDVEEVIRYFVVHNFVCNFDSYTGAMIHNYYLYEKDGVLSMIPWDYNLAFGGFMGVSDSTAMVNFPIDTPVSGGTVDSRPMLAWIFADEEYTALYHRYFEEFLDQCFADGWAAELIDSTRELIAPYVEKDPTRFCTWEEFEAGTAALQQFCALRAESISGQLDGTIPATSEGQQEARELLVDASGLTLTDMGSMGGREGMPGPGMGRPGA